MINANDIEMANSILTQNGYNLEKINDNIIEIKDESAILKPDSVATIMVNAGCPPTLLKVEEEDLESYFLKTIGMKGGLQ